MQPIQTGDAVIQQNTTSDTLTHSRQVTSGYGQGFRSQNIQTLNTSFLVSPYDQKGPFDLPTGIKRTYLSQGNDVCSVVYRFLQALEKANEEGKSCIPLLRDLWKLFKKTQLLGVSFAGACTFTKKKKIKGLQIKVIWKTSSVWHWYAQQWGSAHSWGVCILQSDRENTVKGAGSHRESILHWES